MLSFYSANERSANTERGLKTCFKKAFGEKAPDDLQVIIVYATLGHKLDKIYKIIDQEYPGVTVLGASCGGVVGPDGPGESMNEIAILAVSGPENEISVASESEITADNTLDNMVSITKDLNAKAEDTSAVLITIPGTDCAMDRVVEGFSEVLPDAVHLTGGVSSDNMKGVTSFQSHDGRMSEHMIWAVAFSDPTLKCVSRATHGFDVIGETLKVTETDDLAIVSIDDKPAMEVYSSLYKVAEDNIAEDLMPFGAMGEKIPEEFWKEYGSEYRLNGLLGNDGGKIIYRTHFKPGTELRMAVRNEAKIFSEMKRIIGEMVDNIDGDVVAVSHSDCVARGRFSLNEFKKEELIGIMQNTLAKGGDIPPWIGMYGFGEFCQLGGKNYHHTFTTSITAIYRKKS